MFRLSKTSIGNCILCILWAIFGIVQLINGGNYGGITFKLLVAVLFLVMAVYGILCDCGTIKPFSGKTKTIFGVAGCAVLVGVFLFNLWNCDVETNVYKIESPKIPKSFDGFRIAQISDLHNAEFDKYNSEILSPVFHSKPDIIVITGDMIDSRNTNVEVAIELAKRAVNIAPTYYINGNHESRLPKEYEELKEGLSKAGVMILENDMVDITRNDEKITLIGLNDPTFDRMGGVSMSGRLSFLIGDNDNYKILLAHKPEFFAAYAGLVDLVFSGHAHGGQFNIPFVGGVIAPGQGFFPEYYQGCYFKNGTEMIVSRGIGNSIIPFRINNKPEIIVAELVSN